MRRKVGKIFRLRNILTVLTVMALLALILSYLSTLIHPETVRILPLFGLAYWIIFLGNVILLITWFILKSKMKWLVLGVLLVGGTIPFRTFCFGWDNANDTQSTELKLVSYNVRLFDLYNPSSKEGLKTRSKIFNYLRRQEADVYCLQEFYHQEKLPQYDRKDTLKEILSSPHLHTRFSSPDFKTQSFGVAIYSKHKIVRQGEITFSDVDKTYNYCIYVDIVKRADTFRVYNVHFQSIHFQKDDYALFNDEESSTGEMDSNATKLISKLLDAYPIRAEQAKKVLKHISGSPHPVIVCGDFNDTPMSYTYSQFSQDLVDAYRNTSIGVGSTYAGKVPAGRIDYIFHDQSMGSCRFAIQKEKLSDHYGISCTVFSH
ncbi:MAG: endonuclease/exonuclease/phosphatase family metal-dependent hydrolase [Flavobacteriaceae bacterium]|jgi:endonuclease/exonuclease/phosphatase family metal-dependent hydrolase